MRYKFFIHRTSFTVLVLFLLLLVVVILCYTDLSVASDTGVFRSPLANPLSSFDPSLHNVAVQQLAFSEAAQKASAYIAQREGIPVEALTIASDHPTEYPALGRKFQVVTLVDTRFDGEVYKLLVDLSNGQIEEDIFALLAAEAQAYQARNNKLEPALYERLQVLEDDDIIPVAVWVKASSNKGLAGQQQVAFATLVAKYPEAKIAVEQSGKPMDVEDPELAERIYAEYIELLNDETSVRTQPLIAELSQQGFTVVSYEGIPSFSVSLPKRMILDLAQHSDVSSIYLIEINKQFEMDSAAYTALAPTVWIRGYNGTGVNIAILDIGNVESNNPFLTLLPDVRPEITNVSDHATHMANIAAGFHSAYEGIAPGAAILSTGEDGTQSDEIVALQWAFSHGAQLLSNSGGFEEDTVLHWNDRAFDYWTRNLSRLVVKSAGNNSSGAYHLTSPGKAWNLITVGAIDDNNTSSWADDMMWVDSSYTNPVSPHGDREKPEVVAVGASVTAPSSNGTIVASWGTSSAVPQVAGVAALLIDRNPVLIFWPEAIRAIIMASATHNIEGPSIIARGQGDLRDGAGAINADLADIVAQTRMDETTTCYSSCWWGEAITDSNFPKGTRLERHFYADQGDLIRVVIAWWANADTPSNDYSFSQLDTDLDLFITNPNGMAVSSAASVSWDNNYEMGQFVALQSGEYTISVQKN